MTSERSFSIDFFVAKAAAMIVAATPLWIATSPLWIAFVRRQRRLAVTQGLRSLMPVQIRTLARYAEAMMGTGEPQEVWDRVALRIDRFLATHRTSPRAWRVPMMILALEIAPIFTGRLPASWISRRSLRCFVITRLSTATGVWGRLAITRQLIRMAYYDDPVLQARIGYLPLECRSNPARGPRPTPKLSLPTESHARLVGANF